MVIGFDYGIKPRLLVVGDFGFPEFLRRSLAGLGYSLVPQFGLLVNPPLLVMIFGDAATARECFEHFRGWCEKDPAGDAIGMVFVEYDSGEYGLCIFQEPELLQQRLVPETELSEFQPIATIASHLKMFPVQSSHYKWFKSTVQGRPFVLVPGTTDGTLLQDLAIRKDRVDFYTEHNIPIHSPAITVARRGGSSERPQSTVAPEVLNLNATEIGVRRCAQISRFFPLTIEQLAFTKSHSEVRNRLTRKGFQPWQVVQAACNVSLKSKVPKLYRPRRSGGEVRPDRAAILDYLLNNFEDVSTAPQLPSRTSSYQTLRSQIHADSLALLAYVDPDHIVDPKLPLSWGQQELGARGLLLAPDIQ